MQRYHAAISRKCRIQRGEVAQINPRATQRQRQGRIGAGRQPQRHPGGTQRHSKAQRANPVEQGYRRQVERPPQCLGRCHGTGKTTIEILRGVAAKPVRQVGNDAGRRSHPILKCHRVDERFQRRSWGPQRPGQIQCPRPSLAAAAAT